MANITGIKGHGTGGWEESDFPIVCETCLGPNPFVRMTRAVFDKECKICERPFTIFRWKPGARARYKKTEVCQTCAKAKNVCQTCILDLEFGLPVQVRDSFLEKGANPELPKSAVALEFQAQMNERAIAQGALNWDKTSIAPGIKKLARTTPYYKRNRAHICSFFVAGTCKRGDECPYRHELPTEGPLAEQNIKDRYYGINDPVAHKIMGRAGSMPAPKAPEDETVTTIYVGGVTDPSITEQDLRDKFYSFGEIASISIVRNSSCAFVTYTTRDSAQGAIDALFDNCTVKGNALRLSWGHATQGGGSGGALPQQSGYSMNVPPPPGMGYGPGAAAGGAPPAPVAAGTPYYPSQDPRQMGAYSRRGDGQKM